MSKPTNAPLMMLRGKTTTLVVGARTHCILQEKSGQRT